MIPLRGLGAAALAVIGLLGLAACATGDAKPVEGVYPNRSRGQSTPYQEKESIFGEGGLGIGMGGGKTAPETGGGIGVNNFLWRASLDTVAFMPVNSADPFGGVIITDWYAMPETPNERFKMNVYILSRSLRADGVRVAVFRQVQDPTGSWQDAPVPD